MQTLLRPKPGTLKLARTPRFRRALDGSPLLVGRITSGSAGVPGEALLLEVREGAIPRGRPGRRGGVLDIRASAPNGARRALAREGLLRFPADRIFKGVVEALTPGALEAGEDWALRFPLTSRGGRDRLTGVLGFRVAPPAAVGKLLERSGPLAIKAQFALWARWFADAGDRPVALTLSQLCDDLGFARLQNGAHRPEHKRQAAALLELLTSLELDAEYRAPDGRTCPLRGAIWHVRSMEDGSFLLAPGAWSEEPVWKAFNGGVGLVGEGLLRLRQDRDRWTLCVAGYLAPLARMNGYRPLTLRVSTLEERTGLLRAERRNPARRHEMLERALDRCVETGLIGSWDFAGGSNAEPDMDSAAELSSLVGGGERPEERRIVIQWPAVLRGREATLQACRERRWRKRSSRGRATVER